MATRIDSGSFARDKSMTLIGSPPHGVAFGSRDLVLAPLAKPLTTAQEHHIRESRHVLVPPDDVPRDLVTMNSTVTLVDTISGTHWEITLVYPEEHDAVENCWSVLSPVGSAVFGLRLYAHADVRRNDLPDAEWVVAYISFQPETWGWMTT